MSFAGGLGPVTNLDLVGVMMKSVLAGFGIAITLIAIYIIFNMNQECPIQLEASRQEQEEFLYRVDDIGASVVDLTDPSALLASKEFIEVYEHPDAYMSSALKVIQSESASEMNKDVALYSMTNLSKCCFVELVRGGYEGYREGRVSDESLTSIVMHNFGRKMAFVEAADLPAARRLMDSMISDESLNFDLHAFLSDLRAGDY